MNPNTSFSTYSVGSLIHSVSNIFSSESALKHPIGDDVGSLLFPQSAAPYTMIYLY